MNKLEICNRALAATGNATLVQLNDGSDEGVAVEFAFDRTISRLMGEYQWQFRLVTEDLVRTGASTSGDFTDTFAIPASSFHLRDVHYTGTTQPAHYQIINGVINAYAASGLTATYVAQPVVDSTWHPMAVEVMTMFVEALLLRSLNEDYRSAEAREQKAEEMLYRAEARTQQQEPARNAFMGRIATVRRFRRGGWWGSGVGWS